MQRASAEWGFRWYEGVMVIHQVTSALARPHLCRALLVVQHHGGQGRQRRERLQATCGALRVGQPLSGSGTACIPASLAPRDRGRWLQTRPQIVLMAPRSARNPQVRVGCQGECGSLSC